MKTFRFIGVAFLALVMSAGFIACSSDKDEVSKIEEDEYVVVPLTLSGEHIEIRDFPLSRSGTTKKPYYAVEIKELNTNTSSYVWYAAGIFDNVNDMFVKFKKSKKYNIVIALLYDYLDNYKFNQFKFPDLNVFDYTSNYTISEVDFDGDNPFTLKNGDEVDAVLIDSYYGFLDDYTPSASNECKIELKRATTALELVVEGLESGSIGTIIKEWTRGKRLEFKIESPQTTKDIIITFRTMVDLYSKKINNYVNKIVEISYFNNEGIQTNLIDKSMEFKRGYRKRILIKLNSDDKSETNNNFSISLEELDIVDEPQVTFEAEI